MRASRTKSSRKRGFSVSRGGTPLTATFFSNPSSPRRRQRCTSDIPPEAIFRRTAYFPGSPGNIRLPPGVFLRDPQLLHLPVDAGAVQPELLGCPAHIEVVFPEFPGEILLLERKDRLPEVFRVEHTLPRLRSRLRPLRQVRIRGGDHLVLGTWVGPHKDSFEQGPQPNPMNTLAPARPYSH